MVDRAPRNVARERVGRIRLRRVAEQVARKLVEQDDSGEREARC